MNGDENKKHWENVLLSTGILQRVAPVAMDRHKSCGIVKIQKRDVVSQTSQTRAAMS
jgi:hypothetical protein